MEETIDLREYIGIIKKRFNLLAIIVGASILIGIVTNFFILDPVYQADTTLMVNKGKNDQTNVLRYDDVMLNQKLAITYGEIARSRAVLERVITDMKLDVEYEELSKIVTITPVKDTEILKIAVVGEDAKLISNIANKIPQVFTDEVIRITKADSVQVIDQAKVPVDPIKPRKALNVAITAVLSTMIGLFVIFLLEYLDTTIKTPQDVERELQIPILGIIPLFPDEETINN